MRCSFCKKDNAFINIHEYSERGVKKVNLCLECALKKGLRSAEKDIDNLFVNLIKNVFGMSSSVVRKGLKSKKNKLTLVCPSCGTTIENFSDELQVGCPTCYSIFEKIIDLIIYKQNGSINYIGKLPNDLNSIKEDKIKLGVLKKELSQSIRTEDYSKAAFFRDEIKELKKKMQKRIRKIANR